MTFGPKAAAGLLAAAVLASHLPLLTAGYVQDDHVAVEGSVVVARGSLASIFGASYWEGARGNDRTLYRPTTVASYALERAATGAARPEVSHAINLALHAAVCWLVFGLAARYGADPRAALLAALLFAVCPSKSEAVANVVGRAELLAALFTLAAVRLASEEGSRLAAWGAAICVLLACGSKETGLVAFPLVVLAALGARRPLDVVGMIAPSLLALTVFLVMRTEALETFFMPQTVPVIDNPLVREHGARYAATALGLVARYARIVVLPLGLANDYSGASVAIESSIFGVRPIVGAILLAGLLWTATRGRAAALFAAMTLLPYLLVGNLFVPVGAILAERFLYLPVAGLCLLAALPISRAGGSVRAVVIGVIAVFGMLMFARSLDWKDDATIFAATARNNPKSPRAPYWLGRYDETIAHWPEFAGPWHDKGLQLAKAGDFSGAERAFREAVRIEPAREEPHVSLGLALHRLGRLDAAEREVRKALLLDPGDARAWAELGHLRYETGRRRDAADAYRRAVALGRTDLLPRLRELE